MKVATKLHVGHIECAVVHLLNYRVYTIVPNVSFGLGLNHECDLLCLDAKGRFTEIEIKISAGDLKADFKKSHGHRSKYIGRLVYAMPEDLIKSHGHLVPQECGLISVGNVTKPKYKGSEGLVEYTTLAARWIRQVKHDKDTQEVPDKTKMKFMQLGCMRIWTLKQHNNKSLRTENQRN